MHVKWVYFNILSKKINDTDRDPHWHLKMLVYKESRRASRHRVMWPWIG
jgi:hypothetical protein